MCAKEPGGGATLRGSTTGMQAGDPSKEFCLQWSHILTDDFQGINVSREKDGQGEC